MKNYVWVTEMLINKKYLPIVSCALTKKEIEADLEEWRRSCPDDRFRIKKYVVEDNC